MISDIISANFFSDQPWTVFTQSSDYNESSETMKLFFVFQIKFYDYFCLKTKNFTKFINILFNLHNLFFCLHIYQKDATQLHKVVHNK